MSVPTSNTNTHRLYDRLSTPRITSKDDIRDGGILPARRSDLEAAAAKLCSSESPTLLLLRCQTSGHGPPPPTTLIRHHGGTLPRSQSRFIAACNRTRRGQIYFQWSIAPLYRPCMSDDQYHAISATLGSQPRCPTALRPVLWSALPAIPALIVVYVVHRPPKPESKLPFSLPSRRTADSPPSAPCPGGDATTPTPRKLGRRMQARRTALSVGPIIEEAGCSCRP